MLDCKGEKQSTALARLNHKDNIQLEFENIKLAEYKNLQYAMMRKAVEIRTVCNDVHYFKIDGGWASLLEPIRRKNERGVKTTGSGSRKATTVLRGRPYYG